MNHRLGLLIGFCATLCSSEADHVRFTQDAVTIPWSVSTAWHQVDPANKTRGRALWFDPSTRRPAGDRSFKRLRLENRFLTLDVLPEVGGPVARAVYRPTGEDLFFWEGKAKDWLPFWESGVKASFPYREHGVPTDGAPCGWRILHHDDGSVSLALWQEFSRNTGIEHCQMFGRHSTMFLSQIVTLRPGEACFSIRYHITNPTLYRQGRQFWCDALFPRFQAATGCIQGANQPPKMDDARFIFPAQTISDHWGRLERSWSSEMAMASAWTAANNSVFAWDPLPFCGFFYPQADLNRLRMIENPGLDRAPGAKIYLNGTGGWRENSDQRHMDNFLELWGGTDAVFEGVASWIESGHATDLTYRFALAHNIGKVIYADALGAVGGGPDGLRAITWRDTPTLRLRRDDREVVGPCGPEKPLFLADGTGERIVRSSTTEEITLTAGPALMDPSSPRRYQAIRAVLADPSLDERLGEAMVHGRHVTTALRKAPAGSTAAGRLRYRIGDLAGAVSHLRQATTKDPGDGEAWMLLSAALLEKGEDATDAAQQAVAAERPTFAALMILALDQLRLGNRHEALKLLNRLIIAEPGHQEARLLKSGLLIETARLAEARTILAQLETEDPADPRLVWLLTRLPEPPEAVQESWRTLQGEPGLPRRLEEFQALLQGRWLPPQRIRR